MGKRKRTRSEQRDDDEPNQKTLKRTPVTRSRTKQSKVVKTPDVPTNRRSLGPRRRRSRRHAQWTYIGNCTNEKNEVQTAKPGDIVEADLQIIDPHGSACGTRFVFERYEGGFVVGHLQGPNGRVDLRKTAGHVSVCHAEALQPNSGNLGSRKRTIKPSVKQKEANASKIVRKGPALAQAIVDAHKTKGKSKKRTLAEAHIKSVREQIKKRKATAKELKEKEFTKVHGKPVKAGRMGLRRPKDVVSDESDPDESDPDDPNPCLLYTSDAADE